MSIFTTLKYNLSKLIIWLSGLIFDESSLGEFGKFAEYISHMNIKNIYLCILYFVLA